MKNQIVLTADADLKDHLLREWVDKLFTRIETLNERTKRQTMQIRDLEKEMKRINERRKK